MDEMGPLGVRSYPAGQWSKAGKRPKIAPDYGGHDLKLWVLGALEPATGVVLTATDTRRTRHEFITFLDQVTLFWPEGELVLIMDNLAVHRTLDVQLWAVVHQRVRFLFQPTYSPWLNLIEPWWQTLRRLALKGRSFTQTDQMASAIAQGTQYWLAHRHPYVWRKAA